jgi:hypothetical protein
MNVVSVVVESVIDNFELKFAVNLIRPTKGSYENGEEQIVRVTRPGNFQ